ncbi:MAG: hypothetical protein M1518_01300 [Candidatus Thermoplasmatota archaeon]|jgi:hypothetical protein|nr:hypothetical protein [Candidatus Thermoplasmatota archaeon]
MYSKWKIYVKDRDNLQTLLNLILVNRETEMTIRKNENLTILINDDGKEAEILRYAREELGNKMERSFLSDRWKENIFLLNKPKFYFDPVFPFLTETAILLIKGDEIRLKVERYRTLNPFKRKRLGGKAKRVLYRIRLFSPFLARDYSSKDGKQSLTFKKGNSLIVTSFELYSLINGGDKNGLLAL